MGKLSNLEMKFYLQLVVGVVVEVDYERDVNEILYFSKSDDGMRFAVELELKMGKTSIIFTFESHLRQVHKKPRPEKCC